MCTESEYAKLAQMGEGVSADELPLATSAQLIHLSRLFFLARSINVYLSEIAPEGKEPGPHLERALAECRP